MDGIKFDSDKPRWDLLPLDLIEPVVRVLTMGAKKYADDNWKIVPDARKRYFSALMRHLTAWQSGEKVDPESGESHIAHAICNLIFLEWLDGEPK
jgi:ribosomal protein L32